MTLIKEPPIEAITTPLFELTGKDGHVWRLYENGTSEGFPEGVVIVNRASAHLNMLRGLIIKHNRLHEEKLG